MYIEIEEMKEERTELSCVDQGTCFKLPDTKEGIWMVTNEKREYEVCCIDLTIEVGKLHWIQTSIMVVLLEQVGKLYMRRV